MDAFMRDSDAFSWYMERDPVLRSTIVAVAWLERSPDWEVLRSRVDLASRRAPRFRQRVVEASGMLGTPRWVDDPRFDLAWHFRRIGAPPPHTPRTVVEYARHEAEAAFDRARPLWQFTLIEGLVGGRAALVMKLHHALTDGIGGIELAMLLFDAQPVVRRRPEGEGTSPADGDGDAGCRCAGRSRGLARVGAVAVAGARRALPWSLQLALHPLGSVTRVLDDAGSIYRTVAPVRRPLSPVMRERGVGRHLAMLECSLDDLARAAHAAGGTVNDAFIAAVTGGLRRYHERHGAPVRELRVTLPISIRGPEDPVGGNRITLLRLAVGVADRDPRDRIPAIHRVCQRARHERSLAYTDAIAGTLNLFPAGVVGGMLRHVDFLASDVPGFPSAVYLAGARVERYVAFSPTIGASMNLTLLSYDGRCTVGVNVDSAAAGDGEVLLSCLAAGFEEVLALAGPHDPVRVGPGDELAA